MSEVLTKLYKCELMSKVDTTTGIDKMHLHQDVVHQYIDIDYFNKAIKFCIIRNPYNKVYSAWWYLRKRYPSKNVNDFVKNILTEEFIYSRQFKRGDAHVHHRPQYTFVYSEGVKNVDYIMRFENLNDDITNFNKQFNFNIPLYGTDKCKSDKYKHYFNRESIQKINRLYEKDFLYFNYTMI